jgi:hypothetical protein
MSARLMFIGMFNFSDDNGNIDRSSKQLKMKIFPADTIDCEVLVNELTTHGMLIEYSVSEKKYLHIKGFKQHQVINRPSKTNIPEYNLSDDSLGTHGGISDGREGKGREGKKRDSGESNNLNVEAWGEWITYRKKRKLAEYATERVMKKLSALSYDSQAACVQSSIDQNYNGLFPDKFSATPEAIKNKSDSELLQIAGELGIYTQGKNRYDLISDIEAKQ